MPLSRNTEAGGQWLSGLATGLASGLASAVVENRAVTFLSMRRGSEIHGSQSGQCRKEIPHMSV